VFFNLLCWRSNYPIVWPSNTTVGLGYIAVDQQVVHASTVMRSSSDCFSYGRKYDWPVCACGYWDLSVAFVSNLQVYKTRFPAGSTTFEGAHVRSRVVYAVQITLFKWARYRIFRPQVYVTQNPENTSVLGIGQGEVTNGRFKRRKLYGGET